MAREYVAKTNHDLVVVRFSLSFFPHLTDSQPHADMTNKNPASQHPTPSHFLDSPTRTLSAMDSTTVRDETMKRRVRRQREGFGNGWFDISTRVRRLKDNPSTYDPASTSRTQRTRPIDNMCGAANPSGRRMGVQHPRRRERHDEEEGNVEKDGGIQRRG